MSEKPTVIVVHESLKQSVLSDAFTFALLAAFMVPGVLMDSAAIQWTGSLMFFLAVLGKVSNHSKRKTIAEARAFLDELERAGRA